MVNLFNSNSSNNFYISGIIAISFYVCVLFSFVFYTYNSDVVKFDSFKKNTVLELEVILSDSLSNKVTENKNKNSKLSKEIVKKATSSKITNTADIKSLFSSVKTTSKKVNKKEVLNVKKSLVSSRYKSKFEKQKKSTSLKVSNILNSVQVKKSTVTSSDAKYENDPYYSKIYELLAQRWKPMLIIDELFAKVLVQITADGTFSYRFISNSGNDVFDTSLKTFLTDQTSLLFPTHNKGSKVQIEVIFKSEKG